MNRVLSLQDISCFGKCSLTLALPLISAMGVECVPIPTALLSTHTGGLGDVEFVDLTDNIMPVAEHLKRLKINFDVIHIGYLGSAAQIDIAKKIIDIFKHEGTTVLLDPVMGDNGALYRRFDMEYVKKMRSLAAHADYVLPNLTEAALLTDVAYTGETAAEDHIGRLFETASARFPSRFIVTGVCSGDDMIGAVSRHSDPVQNISYMTKCHNASFHGTGDVFAGVMAGALAKGFKPEAAVCLSVEFTAAVIKNTILAKTDERFGVRFEDCLSLLTRLP